MGKARKEPGETLSDYQQRFIAEYIIDPCKTRAVIKARGKGQAKLTYNAARVEGQRLLAIPAVRRELKAAARALQRSARLKAKHVLDGLANIVLADPVEFTEKEVGADGKVMERVKSISELPRKTRLAIKKIKFADIKKSYQDGKIDGEDVVIEQKVSVIEIELNSRDSALDKAAKILGLYIKDNEQKHGIKTDAEAEAIKEKLRQRGFDFTAVNMPSDN